MQTHFRDQQMYVSILMGSTLVNVKPYFLNTDDCHPAFKAVLFPLNEIDPLVLRNKTLIYEPYRSLQDYEH